MSEWERGQTGSIHGRTSKLNAADLATVQGRLDWLPLLPDTLAAGDLRRLLGKMVEAKRQGLPLIWMCGAHMIKVGLSPILIELMQQGWITHLALNGAGIVHDVELALFGHTSENVEDGLATGSFGQTEETNAWINRALLEGDLMGMGKAVGTALLEANPPFIQTSILGYAKYYQVPATIHVGIGTDVFQTHPTAVGAVIGDLSLRDFHLFVESLHRTTEGGVLLNWGSAVLLPEIALKAFSVLRAHGYDFSGLTTANFDMIQSYRGRTQIVDRVKAMGGWGACITGHHEIMLPLIAAQLLEFDQAFRLQNLR